MKEFMVLLDSVNKVKNFVDLAQKCEGSVAVYSGKYIVDGKSIMGMYSLDLVHPVKVEIEGNVTIKVREGMAKLVTYKDIEHRRWCHLVDYETIKLRKASIT